MSIDIRKELQAMNAVVYNREISYLSDETHPGIQLDARREDGILWFRNIAFSSGIIECDVRGKDIKQHSFVGIAFHGSDTTTYEAIYLRPFNFQAKEDVRKSRAVQYISMPDHPWRKLRENFPAKYESSILPAPDPNSWVHMKIVVTGTMISTYLNGNISPSLVIERLGKMKSGEVGFYVADTSGGDFANLKVSVTD